MNKNKDRGLLFIILADIIFAFLYYVANKNSWIDKLYIIPAISVAILVVYMIFRLYASKSKDIMVIQKQYYKVLVSTIMVLIIIQFVVLYSYFNVGIDSYKIVSVVISYMLIYIGNIMPQIKQNSIIGVRTKKTLNNENVWREANRVGGISLVIVGTILFVVSLVMNGRLLILILLVGVVVWSLINDIYISSYCKKNNIC